MVDMEIARLQRLQGQYGCSYEIGVHIQQKQLSEIARVFRRSVRLESNPGNPYDTEDHAKSALSHYLGIGVTVARLTLDQLV